VNLTDYEKEMLDNRHGADKKRAMELLVQYGNALGAERLVETKNVHMLIGFIPYPSVLDTLDADEMVSKFFLDSNEKILVDHIDIFNTTHIWATDLERGRSIGAPDKLCQAMEMIRDYAQRKGISLSATCAPYQIGNLPQRGEHCAWTESSAVPFCNAVLGARTNTETAHSAFAIALTGRVPLSGFHLKENRKATYLIELEVQVESVFEWNLVGYFAGEQVQLAVPAYRLGNNVPPDLSMLKALNAAGASSGGIQMYHILGVTPEATNMASVTDEEKNIITLRYSAQERRRTLNNLTSATEDKVDVVTLGCPHYSLDQLKQAARMLNGRKVNKNVLLWIWTSHPIRAQADRDGLTEIIEASGAKLLTDSCPLVTAGAFPADAKTVATDSAKQAHYTPAIVNCGTWFGTMEECIAAAISGIFRAKDML